MIKESNNKESLKPFCDADAAVTTRKQKRLNPNAQSLMSEGNNYHTHNQQDKFIAGQKPKSNPNPNPNRTKVSDIVAATTATTAKASTTKLCNCRGSEPGKIRADIDAHKSNCWIRKRLLTKRYTIGTFVTPERFNDGYVLGVAV
jgi:hypothetical protein